MHDDTTDCGPQWLLKAADAYSCLLLVSTSGNGATQPATCGRTDVYVSDTSQRGSLQSASARRSRVIVPTTVPAGKLLYWLVC